MIASKGFFSELEKLIELPSGCVTVDLHLSLDEPVTVRCVYYPGEPNDLNKLRDENGDLILVTKRYELHEIEDGLPQEEIEA